MEQVIAIVCGAQYGSEGKGAVAAWLADQMEDPICVRVGGPNAGHTVVSPAGITFKLQQVPTGIVWGNLCYIAAGSEIDIPLLEREIAWLQKNGIQAEKLLTVDSHATVLTEANQHSETLGQRHGEAGLTAKIGSTGKGVGAARACRIMREAKRIKDLPNYPAFNIDNTTALLSSHLDDGGSVLIEGTQGYGLGLHTRFYPYCTSGDCRAIDFLAQAGISPWGHLGVLVEPWLVARTYPIRVAGNSGPMLGETTWEAIGQPQEHTTVTNKVRRVGAWDIQLVREAIEANGGFQVKFVLTMLDHLFPQLVYETNHGRIEQVAGEYLDKLEHEIGVSICAVGTGPSCIVKTGRA
jgi:adenylosuccinate synthase